MTQIAVNLSDDSRIEIIQVQDAEPRARYVYEDGKRTDRQVERNGLPVFWFEAVIAIDGEVLGTGRVQSSTERLPELPFGGVMSGSGHPRLVVGPVDQFNLKVTLQVDRVSLAGAPATRGRATVASIAQGDKEDK